MKTLRLDPDQAKMLAGWLSIAAVHLDKQADHLRSCGQSFDLEERITRE